MYKGERRDRVKEENTLTEAISEEAETSDLLDKNLKTIEELKENMDQQTNKIRKECNHPSVCVCLNLYVKILSPR